MKETGNTIIGYCRKSKTIEDEETRVRLLQKMIKRMRARSLVDKTFVSPCSAAGRTYRIYPVPLKVNTKFCLAIDDIEDDILLDMISFLAVTPNVSLVVLDYAGLTTNIKDLKQFIINTPNLENIIVDQLPQQHKIKIFSREQLLMDDSNLALFDCRVACVQRAK
ncbi:hypothetical protein BCR43DRAFT_448696 [Syncephalastrum racemosum]|uniref:Resolvase/invertase-type recombinase catalytic domain-containing protein n=1 Tax=Syncephalastrum racemosum TaxID=13706 RepID=A0A1X2GZ03_SYNRA|nr:hypothetical protein BCR43DRAFT_448707 [Syncephalastrum racemosum]ORY88690.1 hypothetical protein BCR43DRAFT_448696 [Syncephalastrum racemosum]